MILGFLGSFHCVGMCGPIAFMLPLSHNNPAKKTVQVLLYHLGRLVSYGFLGLVFGVMGKGFFLSGYQQQLSILIGVLMIAVILMPHRLFQRYNFSKPVFGLLSKVKQAMGQQFKKRNFSALFTVGILNGFLPCGLIYMALFGALAMGSLTFGIFYMLMFGLGTIPLMSGAAYLGNFLSVTARKKIRQLVPVFVVIIGFIFILRGLGLGIPYLSPAPVHLMVKAAPECH